MPSPGSSTLQRERYVLVRQKKANVLNYILFGGAMVVLAFCGTFLVFHFLSQGFRGSALTSKSGLNSREKYHAEFQESGQCPAICYTSECLRTAAEILEMMDPTVDPCEDFSLFVCGGYKRVATEHNIRLGYLWFTEDEAVKFFTDLIREIPKSVPQNVPGASFSKLRKFYDSCMDMEASEENAVSTALNYLERFGIKNWPHLNSDFIFSDPDLDEVLVRMTFYGVNPFFSFGSRLLPFWGKNETGTEVLIGYNRDVEVKVMMYSWSDSIFHKNGKLEDDTKEIINEIMEFFVSNITLRSEILTDVFSFDQTLYDVKKKSREGKERCGNNSTDDCSDDYDCKEERNRNTVRWCRMITKILDRSGFSKKNSPTPVLVDNRRYFRELGSLLDRYDQRTIAHALALHFLVENAFFMNTALSRKAKIDKSVVSDIRKRYVDQIPEIGRSQFCAVFSCYRLSVLAGAAFFSLKYNNTDFRKEANEISSDLQQAFLSTLAETTWIDASVKERLEHMVSSMVFLPEIYLSFVSNLSVIDALHQEVQISEETFLANDLESRKLSNTFYFRVMDDYLERGFYIETLHVFDPSFGEYYPAADMNIGNLQFPLFAINRPRYANFAFMGYVMGHEIGHGIEVTLYERLPSALRENKSEQHENALKEKKECFSNLYSQYDIYSTGIKVNGSVTIQENIPDYLGFHNAFKAFKKYKEIHGPEEMLPGLHFTNEQMFFILHAQNWCASHTREGVQSYLKDAHSPPNIRILGVESNSDAFSEAFNCAAGSPMNRVKKCRFM